MIPNHLFTLLSMVTMEPPVGFDAAAIRSKKAELLAAIPAVKPAEAVRGQYTRRQNLRPPFRSSP